MTGGEAERSVVVAGGGAFGVPAAEELARRGWQVTLVDPGPLPCPDASSTDISKAVRMDYGGDAFYVDLAEEAIEVWRRWNREAPRPLFHEVGFLLLTREPFGDAGLEPDGYRLLRERGRPVERYPAERIERELPVWTPGVFADGYLNPLGGWADSGGTMAWRAQVARAAGVRIVEGRKVAGLLSRGSRVAGVRLDDGSELRAATVLVAAGAWTPRLLPWLSEAMWPSGQPVLHFAPADCAPFRGPAFPVWGADITRTGWYGFPANDDGVVKVGHHGAGYTLEPGAAPAPDAAHEARCRSFLAEALPALASAPRVGWRVCFYCDTWDGDFWIDHDPDRAGLVVAAGGSGHGFKFVTVLGGLIADVVEGRDNPRTGRFRWRTPGARRVESSRSLT